MMPSLPRARGTWRSHPLPGRSPGRRGAALISVLAVVVFLSLIVVALTVSMKMESQEAHYYAARSSAEFMAWEGVEAVKASLETAAATNAAGTNRWASGPGILAYAAPGATSYTALPLFSAAATNGAGIYAPPDLNRAAVTDDGQPVITGALNDGALNMNVGWIYVFQDGTLNTNQTPTLTAANPVVGRFAYWADDESGRISVNPSWAGGAAGSTNALALPYLAGLSNLFGSSTAALIAGQASNNPLNSVNQLRLLATNGSVSLGNFTNQLSTNRFSLTPAGFSSTLNPFGQPRIVLTTQASNSIAGLPYLNILLKTNSDPGAFSSISSNNLSATLVTLTNYLSTTWPGFTNSFAQKYDRANPTRVTQLALDIIDYVRAAESTNTTVEPIRGAWTNGTFTITSPTYEATNCFVGTTRHPMLVQAAVCEAPTSFSAPFYEAMVYLTLYLPPNYNITSYPIGATAKDTNDITLQNGGGEIDATNDMEINATTIPCTTNGISVVSVLPGSTDPMTTNSYCVIAVQVELRTPPTTTTAPMRISLKGTPSGGGVWEVAPASLSYYVNVPVTSGTTFTYGQSCLMAEVSDPRINKNTADWTTVTDALGKPTKNTPTLASGTSPPQDTTAGGTAVSTASLYMPPPATAPGKGHVHSVAELGYVTTGAESYTTGTPWRTIRLQPTPAGQAVAPPDWALLDLFVAPQYATNPPALYPAPTNTITGRINLNSGLPFTNNPNVSRLAPLQALYTAAMQQATNTTLGQAVVTNIAAMELSTNNGGTNYGVPAYLGAGELAEVSGVADGGEASETNLDGLVDLATAQGGAFHIFSIGQALKQTTTTPPSFVVQAEQYKEAVVRSYNPGSTNTTTLLWKLVAP